MPVWLAARACAFAALCAFGMQPVMVQAQATLPMTPDRSRSNHPVIGVSASGAPLVNIVAPNQAGVSLNHFTNYNVGVQGAVIVNTPRGTQTQIAGWVQGNPLMGNAPARLIINQVTSGNPTRLLGMTEIAGNRANLVVANPAGITCAGCGFINVPRVSLATALPAFNADGSLAGFDVTRGRLGVTGGGLDARGSAIDLIARAMQINGQIWAESVAATAGANRVNYADGAAVSKTGEGEKPGVAIDVQALGGMYANSVRLIGTEAGVGVRHSGDISSLTGSIELSANGDITIEPSGRIQAAGPLRAGSPNLRNAGTITSRHAVRLGAKNSLRNDGLVAAEFDVGLAAREIANSGAVIAGVNTPGAPSGPGSAALTGVDVASNGTLAAGDNLNITGTTVSLDGGDVYAASALNVTGDQSISMSRVNVRAINATFKANGKFVNGGGSAQVAGKMKIDARSVSSRSDGVLMAQTLVVDARHVDNAGGYLVGRKHAQIHAADVSNDVGHIGSTEGTVHLVVKGCLSNEGGEIAGGSGLSLDAQQLISNRGGRIGTLAGDTSIRIEGRAVNEQGLIASAGQLNIDSAALNNTQGQIDSAKVLTMAVNGELSNDGGLIVASDGLTLDARAIGSNSGGRITTSAGDARVVVRDGMNNANGTLVSAGALDLQTQALDNTGGAIWANASSVDTTSITNDGGAIGALTRLSVRSSDELSNRQGSIVANTAQISSTDLTNTDGVIESRVGSMDVKASGSVANARGSVVGANGLDFGASSLASNEGGQIGAVTGAAEINVASELRNVGGTLGAGDKLTIQADTFDNASGTALGKAVDITAGHRLKNAGGQIVATRTTQVQAGMVDNQHGVIGAVNDALTVHTPKAIDNTAGKLLAGGDFTSTSAGLINPDGVVSGAHVTLNDGAGHIDNTRGVIDAASRLDTGSGSLDNRSGLIQSGGAIALDTHAGLFDNRTAEGMQSAGRVIGRSVRLTTGALENSTGLISSSDTMRVSTHSVTNDGGAILSHQELTLESVGALSNVAGQIGGGADVTLKGTTVDNTRGAVHAGQALVVTGDEIINNQTKQAALDPVADMPPLRAGMEGANVSLAATARIDNAAGSIRSDQNASIVTPIVDNTDGVITSAKRVSIDAGAAVKNRRGEINGGRRIDLSAAVLNNDGRIESRGDVSARVGADLTNTGAIIAGRNLDLRAKGNVDNRGAMNAQNVAKVSGQRVDNALTGEINGDHGTYVHAQQSVSNEGLIDGGATRVNAVDTIANAGRIYGDSVSLGSQAVRNEANAKAVGAAIASRGDIDIGAKLIENEGDSLIYASNDLRTGRSLDANGRASEAGSDRFTNNGSVADAGGNLMVAAKRFENLNANFQTQKVTTDSGRQVWYTTPGSTERFDASSVYFYHRGSHEAVPGENYQWALDDDQKSLLLPSKRYPYAEYAKYAMNGVAGKVGRIRYAPPPPTYNQEDGTAGRDADLVGAFREVPDDMWAKFGVTPPPPPPDPRYIKPGGYKVDTFFEHRDLGPDWYSLNVPMAMTPDDHRAGMKAESCVTAAAEQCKPFKAWYDQLSQSYKTLGGAIYAYNNDVESRAISRWTIYDVNVQSTKDVVTATQPGMITAGGGVTIEAETGVNDKSQILAGGRAYLNDAIQDNSQPKGVETFTGVGRAISTWVSGRRFRGDERKSEAVPYVAPVPSREIDLPVARFAATNREPVKRVAAFASAAPGVSGAMVIGTPMQAIEGLTERAPGIAAVQDRTVAARAGAGELSLPDGHLQARAETMLSESSALVGERPASRQPLDPHASTNTAARAKLGPIEIRTVEPNLTVPRNALFQIVPDPGSRYLVQTDPRFTNQRNWLSSETMIAALATNPSSVQKRLGDGFYEQQLVQQQIMLATGQRFIGDYTDNQTQYQALMANGVKAAKRFEMNVGTSLTDAQMAALTDDIVWLVNREVTLADGTRQSVLAPQVYLRAHAADVTGAGSIISADSVVLNNEAALANSGTIVSRRATIITADSITNVGAISGQTVRAQAKEDLKNLGGLIHGNTVHLVARRDVKLSSRTSSVETENGSATAIDRLASIDASTLAVQAGRDLNLDAAQIAASDDALLLARRDVNLTAIRERSDDKVRWGDKNRAEHSLSTDTGASVTSEGKILIAAGRDLNATAANVSAQGSLTALAGGHVNLNAGVQSASAYDEHDVKEHGVLSSKSTHTIDESRYTDAVGTTLSGETVDVSAGNNLTAGAATIAGTGDVTLEAGDDMRITTADTASHEYHFKNVKKSGLGSAGAGISYGKRETTDTSVDQATGARGSLVGSIEGSVLLRAGNKLHVTGSEFIAAQDVTGVAKEVKVDASQASRHYEETHEMKSSGISLAVKSPVIDAIQNVNRQAQGAGKSQHGRAAALHGIAAAGGVADLAGAANGMTSALSGGEKPEAKVELSVGSSRSKSTFVSDGTQHNGSTVKAGGTAQFVATGEKSAGQGNVTIEGSAIAAKDVSLLATDKVNLLNSTDTERTRSTNESKSASAGVSFGTNGWGVSAAMSRAWGDGNSDAQMRKNAHIVASDTATIVSGGDTNIVGANIRAKKVDGDIGGNLNVESVQDMMRSAARQSSVGGGFSVSQGGGSASLSVQRGHASGKFAGVIEQSGIQAGGGGFDIAVRGNTDLKGAYIASAAEAGKNRLTTSTLSYSDIENHSSYRATSGGVSAGGAVGNGGNNYATHGPTTGSTKNPAGALPVVVTKSGSSEAVTRSSVSAGSITIVDEANQKQDVALLNREATQLNGTVEALPDLQNALASQADLIDAAQAATETVAKRAGQYAQSKQRQAREAAEKETDPQLKAHYLQEAKDWAEGGKSRIGLHMAGGALTGGLTGGGAGAIGGAGGAGLSATLAPKLDEVAQSIKEAGLTGSRDVNALLGNLTSNLLAGGVGALVGGPTGAMTSAGGDLYNRQLHPDEKSAIAKQANGDQAEQDKLTKAACLAVKCWAEYPVGSDAYNANYVSQLEASQLGPEIAWVNRQKEAGLFDYTAGQRMVDMMKSDPIGVAKDAAKVVTGAVTAKAGFGFCTTSGVGCVPGAAMMAFGASDIVEGADGLYNRYNGIPSAGINPLRWGFNQVSPTWGNTLYDAANLVAAGVALTAPVPFKMGAADGLNRPGSMFDVTVPRMSNQTLNPFTKNPLPYGTTQGILIYGIGSKGATVINDVRQAGEKK
jgi:filamentous hemagglutinin